MNLLIKFISSLITADRHAKMGGKPEFIKDIERRGYTGLKAFRFAMQEHQKQNRQSGDTV